MQGGADVALVAAVEEAADDGVAGGGVEGFAHLVDACGGAEGRVRDLYVKRLDGLTAGGSCTVGMGCEVFG